VCITDEPVDELLFPFPLPLPPLPVPLPLPLPLQLLDEGMPTASNGSGMDMETRPFGGDSVMSMISVAPDVVSTTSQSLLSSESFPDEVLPRL